jgi:hypothetical protein
MYKMEEALATAGVSTSSIAILFILYKVFNAMKGHRLVSSCCGRKGEVGFDVRDMPPTPQEETKNPRSFPLTSVVVGEPEGTLSVRVPESPEHPSEPDTKPTH